ncbi:P-loop containing nucleoside triphosphate hydrolase protein [Xylariaceae sp. FL1019]|nr:P-loop containing nucleoside triphosphate hydrolase protein [Xylariaceae sp. FL1019]
MSSMVWSEEEKRYFRALLSWQPSMADDHVSKEQHAPKLPIAGEFRILMLGSQGVGKTAILTRFCKRGFAATDHMLDSQSPRGHRRKIQIQNHLYTVDVLEVSQKQLSEADYFQHAVAITEAAVLAYDVRSRDSFDLVQEFHKRIQQSLSEHHRQIYSLILVGNKTDSVDDEGKTIDRTVTWGEGYKLARSLGDETARCAFIETSALSGENIDQVFTLLGRELLRLRELAQQQKDHSAALARVSLNVGKPHENGNGTSKRSTTKWRGFSRPSWLRRSSDNAARKTAVV